MIKLTIGQLIDQLIIQQLKCWHAIDVITEAEDASGLDKAALRRVAKAAQTAQHTNAQRTKLITEIDQMIDEAIREGRNEIFVDRKTYE